MPVVDPAAHLTEVGVDLGNAIERTEILCGYDRGVLTRILKIAPVQLRLCLR